MSQGVRLMAFWAKQAQNGETYHEGKLGGATVRLFLNGYKKSDKDPDVIMYLSQTPFDKTKGKHSQVQGSVATPPRPQGAGKITPRPQAQAAPQRAVTQPEKPAYKDHTAGGYGVDPQSGDVPWPSDDESMPF
jgi:hypothetical protein